MDLCLLVLHSQNNPNQTVGRLVSHSKRQVRSFVGCSLMLEPGDYTLVPLAFNHWGPLSKLTLLSIIQAPVVLADQIWLGITHWYLWPDATGRILCFATAFPKYFQLVACFPLMSQDDFFKPLFWCTGNCLLLVNNLHLITSCQAMPVVKQQTVWFCLL